MGNKKSVELVRPLTAGQNMALIERALHFPFVKLECSDFPLQRLLILMAIHRYGGACPTIDLSERLPAFTKAAVSRHLKALRAIDLVESREMDEDLRRKTWRLTAKGERFMSEWTASVIMMRDMLLQVRQ